MQSYSPLIYPPAWGIRGFCLATEWSCRSRRVRFHSAGDIDEFDRLWRLRIEFADEMEFVRDQTLDFVPIVVEPGEKSIHRRLEIGEGGEVLIVDRGFLEQPPKALDQVEVRCVSRQIDQFDAAIVARQPGLDLF